MFETLPAPALDGIIGLMRAFADDPRPDKLDLGVGVYRDAQGHTPVMGAVKLAEARILATQDTKTYLPLAGDPAFLDAMAGLLLGGAVPDARVAAVGTPGGTGALRQLFALIARARPGATVWVSAQTWPNHRPLIAAAGLAARPYRYLAPDGTTLDRAGMLADLDAARAGDVVLLHGCCHNPTGVDPAPQDWADLGARLSRTGTVPLVDMAYQGLGDGVDADAGGLRHLAARLPEVLVAASCAKSFGLYRDRAALAMAITPEDRRDTLAATLATLNRTSFAFPPDHGGRVVSTILTDPALRRAWLAELDAMRARIAALRAQLADALRAATGRAGFDAINAQRGMFSVLPLDAAQVARLRDAHGIYMLPDGRANIAGLRTDTVPVLADAVAGVLRGGGQ